MEEVTVIMPVYNGERYLAEAIESVLEQTYKNFKFIIINDGSTDGSTNIIAHYAASDSRILPIFQPNYGAASARNRVLKETRSEWIALIDNDDIMLPMRLERQIAFLHQHPDIKVASCRAVYINDTGNEFGKSANHLKTQEDFDRLMACDGIIGLLQPGVLMHRRTILEAGGYREQFWPAEDIDLWTRLAEQGHLILIQDEVLMKYRIHPASFITSHHIQALMQLEWVKACKQARMRNKPEPDWESFMRQWTGAPLATRMNWKRRMFANYFYRKAGFRILGRHYARGGVYLVLAGLLDPGYVIRRLKMQVFY